MTRRAFRITCLTAVVVIILLFSLCRTRTWLAEVEPGKNFEVRLSPNDGASSVTLHLVWVKDLDMWFGETEIAYKQYLALKSLISQLDVRDCYEYTTDWPLLNVSPEIATAFCGALNRRVKITGVEGYTFRLPTIREWEAAARCGQDVKYDWGGNDLPPRAMSDGVLPNLSGEDQRKANATQRLVIPNNSALRGYFDGYVGPCPVKKAGRNAWGLYGMSGNVDEWAYDPYRKDWFVKGTEFSGNNDGSLTTIDYNRYLSVRPWIIPLFQDRRSSWQIGFRVVFGKQEAAFSD